jgi:hypothetical protein
MMSSWGKRKGPSWFRYRLAGPLSALFGLALALSACYTVVYIVCRSINDLPLLPHHMALLITLGLFVLGALSLLIDGRPPRRRNGKSPGLPTSSKLTGTIRLFEVFGRSAQPDVTVAGRVCQTWIQTNPDVNPANASVRVNVDSSGLWGNEHVRAHYPLVHHRGSKHLWQFVMVAGQQYLLLIVFEP